MIAVDRDPKLNVRLVTDPPKGLAQFPKSATLKLQTAPGKTPGELPLKVS